MQRLLSGTRVLFAGITVAALIGGFFGLADVHPEDNFLDHFYGTLQLFVLGNPLFEEPGPWPWYLNVARFAAPAVTGYAIFETARLIAAEQARRLRARVLSGHTVVAGETAFASAVVAMLEARGTVVTRISGDMDVTALRAAGVARADALIACADQQRDPWVNLVLALDAAALERNGRPLKIRAQVSDAALAFSARSMGMTQAAKVSVRFFHVEEVAAKALADTERGHQDVAIMGLQEFGCALLLELARAWHKQQTAEPLRVTVVDEKASAVVAQLKSTYAVIGASCEITVADGDEVPAGHDFSRVYVCYQDESKALHTALATAAMWPSETGGLVVRLDRLAGIGRAFQGAGRLFDDLKGRLRVISVVELASSAMAGDSTDSDEQIARAIHERYLTQQLAQQVAMGARPSMLLWEELSEELREANRAQAAGIRTKLDQIGCTIVVRTAAHSEFAYRDGEIEELAKLEHERWMADKRAAGWTYAPVRNDAAKHHDCLVPWDKLSEEERDKDRDPVRNIPGLLNDVGLQPVRLSRRS